MQIHVSDTDGTPFYQQVVTQIKFLVASLKSNQHTISGTEAGNGLHRLTSIGNPLRV